MTVANDSWVTSGMSHLGKAITPAIAVAIVSLPLSIGFAIIAGVPPEVMIVASIYAAIFNAVFATSKYGVGGPNTAVALLTGAAVAPFAPAESHLYMGYIFALCVMVSVFQLLLALLHRFVDLMDYVSKTVIDGLTVGIGAVFVLSSLNMALGLSPNAGQQWSVFNAFSTLVVTLEGDANSTAMLIAAITMIIGIVCWQIKAVSRYAIVIAATIATLLSLVIDANTSTPVEYIGWLSLQLFATSIPDFRLVSWSTLFHLVGPAAAIALIGAIQTLSIAKGMRRLGEPYRPHRELLSQGLQHLFMGFFSGAPVSNSYNKSILMYSTHGSKAAQLLSGLFTALLVLLGGTLLMFIPMPALGACLVLVGFSMLNLGKHRSNLNSGWQRLLVFVLSALLVVVLSIHQAILIGSLLSVLLHAFEIARPRFTANTKEDHIHIKFTSPLFFASGSQLNRYVERTIDFDHPDIHFAEVDLTESYLLPDDHIDIDWLHRLISADIKVTLKLRFGQKRTIETMMARGIVPDSCELVFTQDRRKSLMGIYHGVERRQDS